MARQYQTQRIAHTRVQSGIPLRQTSMPAHARGLLLRGVVVATYVLDDGAHPRIEDEPVAVYCDVLIYSSVSGMQQRLIQGCLVRQERSGVHSSRIWKPRAAKIDMSGTTTDPANLALEGGTTPGAVDGDHVLVGFLDDSFNLPVILGCVPHPSSDIGNENKAIGHRQRLKLDDGDPDFWKHHGVFHGVDDEGDYIVDTTEAFSGSNFQSDGREPVPVEDGTTGNVRYRLPKGSKLTVEVEGGANLELANKEGDATLKLGDGARAVALAENFQSFWDGGTPGTNVKATYDTHTHPTGVGPSGVPSPLLPVFDTAIISTKSTLPDG